MRIALVLPPVLLGPRTVKRTLENIHIQFGPENTVFLYAPAASLDHFTAILPAPAPLLYDRQRVVNEADVVVFIDGERGGGGRADDPAQLTSRRVYSVMDEARLRLENSNLDTVEYPHLESHVFNRLSPHTPDGYFYYFSWGYLFRYTGWGPLDAFGFRVPEQREALLHRPPEHKLVIVFGGSAAWSMYCLPHEMFASRLEVMLNAESEAAGSPLRFTVLNFGMHGHVVLNQMLTYMLFVESMKPDYVISHDGFNDLGYGQLSDPFLLQQNITYQNNLESWSQILHESKDRPTNQPQSPCKPLNLPPNVVRAYVARKAQFMRQVESAGTTFIWGLQPFVKSKAKPSPEEEGFLRDELRHAPNRPYFFMYNNLPHMYPLAQKAIERVAPPHRIVDLHQAFGRYGEDEQLFADFVHTAPAGDVRIAQCYADFFRTELWTENV